MPTQLPTSARTDAVFKKAGAVLCEICLALRGSPSVRDLAPREESPVSAGIPPRRDIVKRSRLGRTFVANRGFGHVPFLYTTSKSHSTKLREKNMSWNYFSKRPIFGWLRA